MEESIQYKFIVEPIEVFQEVLRSWGGFDDYIAKLEVYRTEFIENGKNLYQPDPNGYNVINHGDFHVKNLLFKKNGADIEDFFFLDYQICVLASPCVDLFYALYNMISDENRRNRRAEIIHDYHNEFTRTLKRLGFIGKIPSLIQLQMDLIKHGQMEVLKCIGFYIFFWPEKIGVTVGEMMAGPDSKKLKAQIFNDPEFKKFILAELPRLVQMGFL